ncbi:MAG: ribosomal protein S18-alanine N-acetyltransferase [Clostridiales bacterium]|nr:ribosomal protein S18-alanine N-acetyltransferase [Clostridiales bacterium]
MIIRKMREEDLASVAEIEKMIFTEPWREEDFRKAIGDSNNLYLVAEQAGEIAGYCGYWGIAGEGNIYNVAVKDTFRRKGLGYRMLSELIRRGLDNNISAYTLEVRCSNTSAINLYERLGFINTGIRKDFYNKPKEDAVIMWFRTIQ